ncbi:YfhJ family protein [Ectobacillus sp. JY-23]|uniref:YfhJ family protein n=1 Tax=Ectobacillus sp. JY-23 TaxID=2933872 RepID=UPI001FF5A303|nr:YfhJ family protein [Ectobacillus sp. JY-23]UOY91812.1 YfhJ family protein [Ectobacillus sp. JY-23]
MNDIYEKLTHVLLEKNANLSYAQARAWVELLWEDTEATYAKSGRYNGLEMTERLVNTWIQNHGAQLHLVQSKNPRFQELLNRDDYLKH